MDEEEPEFTRECPPSPPSSSSSNKSSAPSLPTLVNGSDEYQAEVAANEIKQETFYASKFM